MQDSHLSGAVAKMPGSSAADGVNLPGRCSMPLNHSVHVCGGFPLRSVIVAVASSR
jgi:hypothetical protein